MLLKGVNDDVEVMKEVMQRLIAARVRPYYLYMCENLAGVEHFKTNVRKGPRTRALSCVTASGASTTRRALFL